VRIVVLVKPVPDTTGQERLGPDLRVDRIGVPAVVNANDEYALEAALKLVEAAGEGDVTLLAMAPAGAPETLRKALAMGAQRAVLVSDPSLAGSDTLSTVRVLAAALRRLEYDLVLAGADTSDGGAGIVAAGIAVSVGLPYLSYASKIEPGAGHLVVHRISPVGYDVIESALPALVVATQALGEPRYPSLKGIMAARSKEILTWSLADLELADQPVGGAVATTEVTATRSPAARAATRVVRGTAAAAAAEVVEFLVERRLIS
jgi:electron transfer flavoprotein beta subunit